MSNDKTMHDLMDEYLEQEQLYRVEGTAGVRNLCQIVRAIGYRDQFNQGVFNSKAALGDLMVFLEDNPGAVENLIDWICNTDNSEWMESLESNLEPREQDEDLEATQDIDG